MTSLHQIPSGATILFLRGSKLPLFWRQPNRFEPAFSLVELLVVISVIAIIASLAIPTILNVSGGAIYAKNQRNAQTIAAVAASAKVAGVTNNLNSATIATIQTLEAGVQSPQGLSFSISPLSDDERIGALAFLTNGASNGALIYISSTD